jgi:hypothetical protein
MFSKKKLDVAKSCVIIKLPNINDFVTSKSVVEVLNGDFGYLDNYSKKYSKFFIFGPYKVGKTTIINWLNGYDLNKNSDEVQNTISLMCYSSNLSQTKAKL